VKKKSSEKTLDEYLQLAKNEPDNIGVHMKIADLYLKKGKKEEAIKEYLYSAENYAKEELYQLTMSIYKTVLF
jgi:predicted Zn-dependent protease